MTRIVDRQPFYDRQTLVRFSTQEVVVRSNQIILWVSLRVRAVLSHPFPAVFDTGHSHFFSIGEGQLRAFTGLEREQLRPIGRALVNEKPQSLFAAALFLHRCRQGTRDDRNPFQLSIPEGIAVHAASDPSAPRLPLLGLRALAENNLRTVIDGKRRFMSISHGWALFY